MKRTNVLAVILVAMTSLSSCDGSARDTPPPMPVKTPEQAHAEARVAAQREKLEKSGVPRLPGESDDDMAARIRRAYLIGRPLDTPNIHVTVAKGVYEHGFLKVHGVAENTGAKPAFSPAIELQVYDQSGEVLLAKDTAYPTGTLLANMQPGHKAAFQHMTSVPGQPARIRWKVVVKDYPGDVTMPQ